MNKDELFYLWENEEQRGPFTLKQLLGLWNSGLVRSDSLWCQDGMTNWRSITELMPPIPIPTQTMCMEPAQNYWTQKLSGKEILWSLIGAAILLTGLVCARIYDLDLESHLFGIAIWVCAAALYFLPTLLAANRGPHVLLMVFCVNLLFGWTVIGWLAAIAIIAFSGKRAG